MLLKTQMQLQNVVAVHHFLFKLYYMKFEVIIVGGAYNGLALANALASKGISTCLLEKRKLVYEKREGEPSRLLAIANESCRFLKETKICNNFAELGQSINQIRVADDSSPMYLDFLPDDIELKNFGYMIEEHKLLKDMCKNIHASVKIIEGVDIKSISQNEFCAEVVLSDGRKLESDLLVGADGKNSVVRKVAEIETYDFNYNQHAIICDIKHELNHGGAAIENFMPNGPFAVLPKKGGFESSIVWTVESGIKDAIMSLSKQDVKEVLADKFDGMCGDFTITSDLKSFPLALKHAKQYFNGRIVLTGDALHAIHPLAGQGLNLGLRDVKKLSELIIKQKSVGLDIACQIMLEEYKDARMADNLSMIEGTHYLNLLFSNNMKTLKLGRRIGLATVNKFKWLKKKFMKYAIGDVA